MLTANLTGPLLDYWTARAKGVPAADLEFRATGSLCVRVLRNGPAGIDGVMVLDYSTNWALTGPLVEENNMSVMSYYSFGQRHDAFTDWAPYYGYYEPDGSGDTPLIAICRAVVRAAFGDEVEDLPC